MVIVSFRVVIGINLFELSLVDIVIGITIESYNFFQSEFSAFNDFLSLAFIAVKFRELLKRQCSFLIEIVLTVQLANGLLGIWAVKDVDVLELLQREEVILISVSLLKDCWCSRLSALYFRADHCAVLCKT